MNEIQQINELAKGIHDYGVLVVICSAFLVFCVVIMGFFIWNQKRLQDKFIGDYSRKLEDIKNTVDTMNTTIASLNQAILAFSKMVLTINDKADKNGEAMRDILEGLAPATRLQIQTISNEIFENYAEKVCRLIKKIRQENHIADKERTKDKIMKLLTNYFNKRNQKFDAWKYHGHYLSFYTSKDWINWVFDVVWSEIYHVDGENNGRAYTNVSMVYDRIKADFYDRLN